MVSVGEVIYKEGHNWQATNDSRENTTKSLVKYLEILQVSKILIEGKLLLRFRFLIFRTIHSISS